MLTLQSLPPDVLLNVLSFLRQKELRSLSCTCQLLNDVSRHDEVWRPLCRRVWLIEDSGHAIDWKERYRKEWQMFGRYEEHYSSVRSSWNTIHDVCGSIRLSKLESVLSSLTLREGVSYADIDRAEERIGCSLPDDFKCSLLLHDGQLLADEQPEEGVFGSIWIGNYYVSDVLLGLGMCVELHTRGTLLPYCLPITFCLGKSGGQFLQLKDTRDSKKGELFWVTGFNSLPPVYHKFIVANSFSERLANFAANLRAGQFVINTSLGRCTIFPYSHDTSAEAITTGIKVSVATMFVPNDSTVIPPRFFFAYHITISMNSMVDQRDSCVLRTRYWSIRNGNNEEEVVSGPGVVGEYPTMYPGAVHKYVSCTAFNTPTGTMEGFYDFEYLRRSGTVKVRVPLFRMMALPHAICNLSGDENE